MIENHIFTGQIAWLNAWRMTLSLTNQGDPVVIPGHWKPRENKNKMGYLHHPKNLNFKNQNNVEKQKDSNDTWMGPC